MTEGSRTQKALQADQRQARLAAQLRSNLKKRKQQARARAEADNAAGEGMDEEGSGKPGEGIR